MKKVILLALLLPYPAFGQIFENFEAGSIVNWIESTPGHWKADTSSSLSGKYSLHHIFDNPDAGTDCIGFNVKNLHPSQGLTRWSFLIRYGYDPSSLNNWSVFLTSDKDPGSMSLEGGVRGYAVGVNLTGSDDTLRLWKVDGSSINPVVNSGINWQTDIGAATTSRVTVERSKDGIWVVSVTRLTGTIVGTGSGEDDELFGLEWFGVYYKYTSTRDRLLWFDDLNILGTFYEDKEPPFIIKCKPSGKKSLEITFSEEPDNGIILPQNISMNMPENKSISLSKKSDLIWEVGFANELINKSVNNLIIAKLCDISGNCSQNVKFGFTPLWAETGDIIISEIMADPLPVVSLPDKEYIEIKNRTDFPFNLKNWKLCSTGSSTLFPETIIPASGTFIICSPQDTSYFTKYGRVIGIKQFPSLTDEGKLLYISDSTGTLIHGVEYSSDWYQDDLKSRGGWSLEMIDTGYPFFDNDNWKASKSVNGGTPGTLNSVSDNNPDVLFSGIQNVFASDSGNIILSFSEPVFDLSRKITAIRIGEKQLSGIFSIDPLFRKFSFRLEKPLQKKELYNIEIQEGVTDFAGNQIQKRDFSFGLTEQAGQGDILFNEILFNPLPGDPDYLELYNRSEKIIDVSRLQIVSQNDITGDKSEAVPLCDESKCLLPGWYYAITTNPKRISERYFSADPQNLFETGSMPSMSVDKGHLILYNRELEKIDELMYDDDMHYSLLSTHEGVALEKTNPDSRSEERANWHSATQSSGWGTPGAQNSVFDEMTTVSEEVVLSSSKITPDNDGNEDFLSIRMKLSGNGNVISVMVFDETGSFIRKLASNLYAGTEASLIWDGTADDGSPVSTGIYIVLITRYNDSGKTSKWKKVCTVIRN
jgi:hypothetical protein